VEGNEGIHTNRVGMWGEQKNRRTEDGKERGVGRTEEGKRRRTTAHKEKKEQEQREIHDEQVCR
jgi:hypothetical protein